MKCRASSKTIKLHVRISTHDSSMPQSKTRGKMLKEPSTIKMRRLLEQLIESDARSAPLMRELQQDARKVLGFNDPAEATPQRKPAARKKAATPKKSPPRKKAASRK
jgi:hypothetical protein